MESVLSLEQAIYQILPTTKILGTSIESLIYYIIIEYGNY